MIRIGHENSFLLKFINFHDTVQTKNMEFLFSRFLLKQRRQYRQQKSSVRVHLLSWRNAEHINDACHPTTDLQPHVYIISAIPLF